MNNETIETTPTHPFWVEYENGSEWIEAGELRANDVVRLADGSAVEVECVDLKKLDKPVKVYNFEVEDFHTYYVGTSGVLVHNKCGEDVTKYSPSKVGPLSEEVANSFNGAVYTERVLKKNTVMYRVYGEKARKVGRYVSRTKHRGGLQSQLDLALNPAWGNSTEKVTKLVVPKGTTIYEGTAAPQNIYDNLGNVIGKLPGGGNQVYIPEIDERWFD